MGEVTWDDQLLRPPGTGSKSIQMNNQVTRRNYVRRQIFSEGLHTQHEAKGSRHARILKTNPTLFALLRAFLYLPRGPVQPHALVDSLGITLLLLFTKQRVLKYTDRLT